MRRDLGPSGCTQSICWHQWAHSMAHGMLCAHSMIIFHHAKAHPAANSVKSTAFQTPVTESAMSMAVLTPGDTAAAASHGPWRRPIISAPQATQVQRRTAAYASKRFSALVSPRERTSRCGVSDRASSTYGFKRDTSKRGIEACRGVVSGRGLRRQRRR